MCVCFNVVVCSVFCDVLKQRVFQFFRVRTRPLRYFFVHKLVKLSYELATNVNHQFASRQLGSGCGTHLFPDQSFTTSQWTNWNMWWRTSTGFTRSLPVRVHLWSHHNCSKSRDCQGSNSNSTTSTKPLQWVQVQRVDGYCRYRLAITFS